MQSLPHWQICNNIHDVVCCRIQLLWTWVISELYTQIHNNQLYLCLTKSLVYCTGMPILATCAISFVLRPCPALGLWGRAWEWYFVTTLCEHKPSTCTSTSWECLALSDQWGGVLTYLHCPLWFNKRCVCGFMHWPLQSCMGGTRARLGYDAFDPQLRKCIVTTL